MSSMAGVKTLAMPTAILAAGVASPASFAAPRNAFVTLLVCSGVGWEPPSGCHGLPSALVGATVAPIKQMSIVCGIRGTSAAVGTAPGGAVRKLSPEDGG